MRELEERLAEMEARHRKVEEENKEFADRYIEIEEQNNNLANLYVASYQLHSTLDYDEVLRIVQEIVINLIGAEAFHILMVGEKTGQLELECSEGQAAPEGAVVMGEGRGEPTAGQMADMRSHVRQAMEEGACGLSSGLIYTPGRYSRTPELIELAEEVSPVGGIYAPHMRNEGDRLLEAVDEALTIAGAAAIPLQISHHKAALAPHDPRAP